jgi:hypothetical protein
VTVPGPASDGVAARISQPVALVDLLDRVLAGGVVIVGDVTLCIADVALVRISLRALIASISAEMCRPCVTADAAGDEGSAS